MAILHIVHEDDEVLRKTSREVTEITPRILTLLDDMADTLHKAQGVGLAAVQVGVLRRVVLVETEPGQLYELDQPQDRGEPRANRKRWRAVFPCPGNGAIPSDPGRSRWKR